MSRLVHSPDGFLRLLQMSRVQVFAFVEGHVDRFFYGQVCQLAAQERQLDFVVYRSNELPGEGGGKSALLKLHALSQERGMLCGDFQGKRTALIFFLDKDIDDILGIQVTCAHIIYTSDYGIENHLFKSGCVTKACAISCCLTLNAVETELGDESDWLRSVADLWKAWAACCYFAKTNDITSACNYALRSPINTGQDGLVDAAALQLHVDDMAEKSGMSTEEFQGALSVAFDVVENYYSDSRWDKIFPGKWYGFHLQKKVQTIEDRGAIVPKAASVDSFSSVIAGCVDYSATWVAPFVQSVRACLTCFA